MYRPHALAVPAYLLLAALAVAASGCGRPAIGEAPPQPIAFSHATHHENEITCDRCHRGATRASQAGLPPLETCATCHRRAAPDHPEVQKVLAAWEAREPIRWRKVHVLPEEAFVHFNHRAHARAEIECSVCHGDVASMTVARPVVAVADMGWCVDCHRERGASDDCLTCHR